MPTKEQIWDALSKVADPEIGKPITELDMVKNITVDGDNVIVEIYLTIAGCPLKDRITRDVTAAVRGVPGVGLVEVSLDVMSEEQRTAMVNRLRAGRPQTQERPIQFWQPGTKTRAILIASGKGGVGKSSVTANLGVALGQLGYKVGVVDCDIYGFSIHRVLGVSGRPTILNDMALPLEAHGIKVMSMGFLVPDDQAMIFRGPMLHKYVYQFLAGAYWGDVDFMLFDLPPGTGDVPLSLGKDFVPGADMIVVTTPQEAAQKVAVRAGKMIEQVPLKMLGVVENMSYFVCPSCDERHQIFGEGGGLVLSKELDTDLLAQIPFDTKLRQGSDEGKPIVVTEPDSPAASAIIELAKRIAKTAPSLKGRMLPVMSVRPAGDGHGHSH